MSSARERPIVWRLESSHFPREARWALERKRTPHVRRAVLARVHAL